ncbi:DUF6457 domain-containing protein [Rathayibacter sp. CAU 1779]
MPNDQKPNDEQSSKLPPEALDDWTAAIAAELGIPKESVPIGDVLQLASTVAHGVARPAAPLTAFIVGLAVGSGKGTASDLIALTSSAAENWTASK